MMPPKQKSKKPAPMGLRGAPMAPAAKYRPMPKTKGGKPC